MRIIFLRSDIFDLSGSWGRLEDGIAEDDATGGPSPAISYPKDLDIVPSSTKQE
jgi:hypothetical protein